MIIIESISSILKGVHNVDFSGVRDDKCHTGVGESRVDSIADDAPVHCHRYPYSLPSIPLFILECGTRLSIRQQDPNDSSDTETRCLVYFPIELLWREIALFQMA